MNVGLRHKSFRTTCPSLQLFLIGDMLRCIYDRLCCCPNVEMKKDKKNIRISKVSVGTDSDLLDALWTGYHRTVVHTSSAAFSLPTRGFLRLTTHSKGNASSGERVLIDFWLSEEQWRVKKLRVWVECGWVQFQEEGSSFRVVSPE